jgi:polar amino acid transport system substrate-binding protein
MGRAAAGLILSAGLWLGAGLVLGGAVPARAEDARDELAPGGVLRVGLNHGNTLLVLPAAAGAEPRGIAPDLARELGRRLGVPVAFVRFESPGSLADAVDSDRWDVAFLGAEPERAERIAFSPAYLEIPVSYLVPAGSPLASLADVDREGVRVAVAEKSAYDLYLSRALQRASLLRAPGIDGSYERFAREGLEALAGLRPRLLAEARKLPGSRVLEGQIMAVQQAIGAPRARSAGAAFLAEFVAQAKRSGLVARSIERHAIEGVAVAP